MNRRSFLKTAALATVAVPVVGLPSLPAAVPVKPVIYKVQWKGVYRSGQFTSQVRQEAVEYFEMLVMEDRLTAGMGYVSVEFSASNDHQFRWTYSRNRFFAATPSTARPTPA